PFRSAISPDVLGSIFERFVDQKEKGAYYTKEDVTEYISKNTIIPSIFDAVERRCPDAFCPAGPIWSLLGGNSDGSIYANGAEGKMGEDKPAPLHVAEREMSGDRALPLRIHDFITYNLDICKFARDVIASCERSDLLLAFYESIDATTILDPTYGAGDFLFAA